MAEVELLPCPFCGETPTLERNSAMKEGWIAVHPERTLRSSDDRACLLAGEYCKVTAWNTRTSLPQADREGGEKLYAALLAARDYVADTAAGTLVSLFSTREANEGIKRQAASDLIMIEATLKAHPNGD